jgi:hypothetical protein
VTEAAGVVVGMEKEAPGWEEEEEEEVYWAGAGLEVRMLIHLSKAR